MSRGAVAYLTTFDDRPATGHVVRGRLTVSNRALRYPDGTRFPYVGATAFRVPELLLHGREREAREFLQTLRAAGVTVARMLAMAKYPGFELEPVAGREAVRDALQLARACDLYGEIVACADTIAWDVDLRAQVQGIGAIAAEADNGLVEAANEIQPLHGTQRAELADKAFLVGLGRLVPTSVPFSFGSAHGGDPGTALFDPTTHTRPNVYLTFHDERVQGDRGWRPWRQIRYDEELSSRYRTFVASNEPYRFGATADQDPAHVFAYGLLSRIFGVGALFHFDSGRAGWTFTNLEWRGLEAFGRGVRYFPSNWEEGRIFQNANSTGTNWPHSPVGRFNEADSVRVFSSLAGDEAVSVAIGVQRDPEIQWQNGYVPYERNTNPHGYEGIWIYRSRR